MSRADISSDPSTTSQAPVGETMPEFKHGNLYPPSNLVACDLSGGFEFVSVGLWDLYLQIAGSLGPRRRKRRRRKRRCARKGSLKLQPEGIGHWNFPPVSSLCMEDAISSPKHAATSSLSELANHER